MEKVSLRSYSPWSMTKAFKLPPGIDANLDIQWRAFKYNHSPEVPVTKSGVYDFELDGFLHRIWIDNEGWVHRTNGPAMEMINGAKSWFFRGFVLLSPGRNSRPWTWR